LRVIGAGDPRGRTIFAGAAAGQDDQRREQGGEGERTRA
jgi:hypothetical protein